MKYRLRKTIINKTKCFFFFLSAVFLKGKQNQQIFSWAHQEDERENPKEQNKN